MNDLLHFEQPVTELMRVCLRLEFLFQQAFNHYRGASASHSRSAITAIIDILNILDRPDLKSRLAKELNRHLATLSRMEHAPTIDPQKLAAIILELEGLIELLHATDGKLGQGLRQNEFLTSIRQYIMLPGGTCGFDTPAFYLWLNKPVSERMAHLSLWLRDLETLHAAVTILLRLARESAQPLANIAQDGFFQMALAPHAPCQLIRVSVGAELNLYPEISVGRYGVCLRFFCLNLEGRPVQASQSIPFSLTTCIF